MALWCEESSSIIIYLHNLPLVCDICSMAFVRVMIKLLAQVTERAVKLYALKTKASKMQSKCVRNITSADQGQALIRWESCKLLE